MGRIITENRSLIVAADVEKIVDLEKLVMEMHGIDGVGGFKVGSIVLNYGLPYVVRRIRENSDKPIIYDPKDGIGIPDFADRFARDVKGAGVDAVIVFSFSSPTSRREYMKNLKSEGVGVIVGIEMTPDDHLVEKGGYIADNAPVRIISDSIENGIRDFVVPGNKGLMIKLYRDQVENRNGVHDPVYYSPAFSLHRNPRTVFEDKSFHLIKGREVYGARDMKEAAKEIISKLSE